MGDCHDRLALASADIDFSNDEYLADSMSLSIISVAWLISRALPGRRFIPGLCRTIPSKVRKLVMAARRLILLFGNPMSLRPRRLP